MLINGIEYNKEIIEALKNERLVIFAGAGVSMGEPTKLPDFLTLANRIAEGTGRSLDKNDEYREREDRFLGKLEHDYKVKVRELASQILEEHNPKPNDTHRNIINLFNSSDSIRIVTTNYDLMFEEACKELYKTIPKCYSAPAVPYGDNFKGIVHLHGSVYDPEFMVLTDEDFGKAYMLKAYASRFIDDVFNHFTVLFVGYSYSDLMVSYLTRAINGNNKSNCFVLTDDRDKDWDLYNLNPVFFPKEDFRVMSGSLNSLGNRLKRGLLGWKKHLELQLCGKPPLDKESIDEIREALEDEKRIKVFLDMVESEEWLYWFDDNGYLDNLFNPSISLNNKDLLFVDWILNHFLDTNVFLLLYKHNNQLNTTVASKILYRSSQLKDGDTFCMFFSALMAHIKDDQTLFMAINILAHYKNYDLAWIAFTKLLSNGMVFNRGFSVEIEASFNVDRNDMLGLSWEKISKGIELFDYKALTFINNYLNNRSLILKNVQSFVRIDNISDYYFSIENDSQMLHRDLIRVVTKIVDAASKSANEKMPYYVYDWIKVSIISNSVLLKRLALYVLREHCDINAENKLLVVINNFDLYDCFYREQIFKLVSSVFDDLSNESQKELVQKLLSRAVPDEIKGNDQRLTSFYYETFNWFVWLKKQLPNNKIIEEVFYSLRYEHPTFVEREHPELLTYSYPAAIVNEESPYSIEEIITMDYSKLVDEINSCKEVHAFDGPSKMGFMNAITQTAIQNSEWAIGLLEFIISNKVDDILLWSHLFEGFKAHNNNQCVSCVLSIIQNVSTIKHPKVIAEWLLKVLKTNRVIIYKSEEWEIALNIANFIVSTNNEEDSFGEDAVTLASNSCPGIAAEIIILLLDIVAERIIPPEMLDLINNIVKSDSLSNDVICVFEGYAAIMYERNPVWTKEIILPFLLSKKEDVFRAAWEGFLSLYRRYNHDFAYVVLDVFCKAAQNVDWLTGRYRKEFILDYACLMIYESDNPLIEHIPAIYNNGFNNSEKAFLIEQLYYYINKLDEEGKKNIWKSWGRAFIKNRLDNIIGPICDEEVDNFIDWPFAFTDVFDQVVDLIVQMNASSIRGHNLYRWLQKLKNQILIDKYPEEVGKLLCFVIPKVDNVSFFKTEILSVIDMIIEKEVTPKTREKLLEIRICL